MITVRSSSLQAILQHRIENISLEFDAVTQSELARIIRNQYMNRVSILCDRVLRHRKILANKSDTLININLNLSARSMKGLLLLFEDATAGGLVYAPDTENYYNPKITKIDVIDSRGCSEPDILTRP